MYRFKAISCMEKVLPAAHVGQFETVKRLRGLKGERVAFQIMTEFDPSDGWSGSLLGSYSLRSALHPFTHVSRVDTVPVRLAAYPYQCDDDYLFTEPGLYPDPMIPVKPREQYWWSVYMPTVLMVVVDIPENFPAGEYPVCFTFTCGQKKYHVRVVVAVEEAVIRKSDLVFTQWFHSDCIADYFHVKMMSEKHWKLIDKFVAMAARTGLKMILTPLFTPALDTIVGGERPTMQLVKAKKTGEKYDFDFSLLERWVRMCRKHGIEYFEMSHFFTQWGACFCPKIEVEIDGKTVKEFGWHVESTSEKYKNFLSQLLPPLTKKLKELGIADKTYFHISDEPSSDPTKPHLRNYTAAKEFLAPYLKGFKTMDALSNVEFYKNGLVSVPVPSTNHIEPFLEIDIPERWCYYCCGQAVDVGNRFIAMPQHRNRILGVQMFLNDIYGFLQWGFNFYNTQLSLEHIDPYACTDAGMAFPAGDGFSVYPYKDGAVESIRSVVFYQGLQDRMLLKMLADKIGLEKAKKFVQDRAGMEITFKAYPRNAKFLEELHDAVLDELAK